jgi:hypothetical protein
LVAAAIAAPLPTTPLVIGGALLVVGASYWYFSEQNRKAAEERAKQKYLAANPDSDVIQQPAFQGGQIDGAMYYCGFNLTRSDGVVVYFGKYDQGAQHLYGPVKSLRAAKHPTANEVECFVTCRGTSFTGLTELGEYKVHGIGGAWQYETFKLTDLILASGGADNGGNPSTTTKPWEQWTDAQRQAAIDMLDDNDWEDIVRAMPLGGTLSEGDILGREILLTGDKDSPYASARKPRIVDAGWNVPTIFDDQVGPHLGSLATGIAGAAGLSAATRIKPDIDALKNSLAEAQKATNDNFNQIKKRLKSIAGFLNFDRILNLLIWWQTLHNAFMLSADLSRSLVSAFSTALKALPGDSLLGLPTESEDGSPLDLATTINSSVETWIKGAIGAENYVQMKTSLAEINRIYQSVANGTNLILSAAQATQSMVELVGERAGRIGNAMKRFGVVGERAYGWMSENMNARTSWFNRMQERISNTQEAVSSVEQIAGSVISIQESVTQLKAEKTQIETSLEKLEVTQPKDNESVKTAIDKEKENSKTPEITEDDLQKPTLQQT